MYMFENKITIIIKSSKQKINKHLPRLQILLFPREGEGRADGMAEDQLPTPWLSQGSLAQMRRSWASSFSFFFDKKTFLLTRFCYLCCVHPCPINGFHILAGDLQKMKRIKPSHLKICSNTSLSPLGALEKRLNETQRQG